MASGGHAKVRAHADRRLTVSSGTTTVILAGAVAVAVTALLVRLPPGRPQVLGLGVLAVLTAGVLTIAWRGTSHLARVLLTAAVALLPLNGIRRGGATASDVLLAGAVALSLLDPGLLRRPLVVPRRFAVGLYLLTLAGLAGSLTAEVAGAGDFARLVVTMAAAVGVLWWSPDLTQVRRLAWAWLLGNTVSVAYAVTTMQSLPVWARPQGLTTHPNALGLLCALSVAFAVFLHSAAPGRLDRRAAVLVGAAAFVGMALSGSRAGAVAVIVVLLTRIALGRSVPAAIATAIGGGIGWLALVKIAARLPDTSAPNRLLHPSASVEASDIERVGRLHDSIAAVEQHPWFGSGFLQATAAHDVFLQVAVAAGLIGAVGFVLACWPTLGALRRSVPEPWRWLGLLPLGYFSAAVVSNNLWDRYVWFCLALGMLAAVQGAQGLRGELEVDAGSGAGGGSGSEAARQRPSHAGHEPARSEHGADGRVR